MPHLQMPSPLALFSDWNVGGAMNSKLLTVNFHTAKTHFLYHRCYVLEMEDCVYDSLLMLLLLLLLLLLPPLLQRMNSWAGLHS